MKFTSFLPLPWVAKAIRTMSLVLLPALASEARTVATAALPTLPGVTPNVRTRASAPYLARVGSPGLMLADVRPEPAEEPRPPEPPKPLPTPTPVAVVPPKPEAPVVVERIETPPPPEPTPTPEPEVIRTGPSPVRILPDDTMIELQAEEVLPYFRYPGAIAQPPAAPTPEQLPRSSATYQLK